MKKSFFSRPLHSTGFIIGLLWLVIISAQNLTIAQAAPPSQAIPEPAWLTYLNLWRSKAGVPPVSNYLPLAAGSRAHSVYMLETGHVGHFEYKDSEWFTDEGHYSAWRSNVAASTFQTSDYLWAIDYWISAPFHIVPMLDPKLEQVGFGTYSRAKEGFQMAATMDVWHGRLDEEPTGTTYPIMFPPDGGETWVIRHSLNEYPNPFVSCEDVTTPSGPAIVLILGNGELVPDVGEHTLMLDDEELDHCLFDETSYVSSDAYEQLTGRDILNQRDAVIILPKEPLLIGKTYAVSITANGETYSWEFSTVQSPD